MHLLQYQQVPLEIIWIQGGDDIISGGAGDDIMIGGYGEDSFVYDDLFDDGDLDRILDFNTDDDQLVAQDGVLLTDGGLNIDGDLLINVSNAAVTDFSTIILQGIADFAAVDIVVA